MTSDHPENDQSGQETARLRAWPWKATIVAGVISFSVVLLVSSFSWHYQPGRGAGSLELVVTPASLNLGEVKGTEIATGTIVISNPALKPITVEKITSECNCTVANFPGSIILKPGDSYPVSVSFFASSEMSEHVRNRLLVSAHFEGGESILPVLVPIEAQITPGKRLAIIPSTVIIEGSYSSPLTTRICVVGSEQILKMIPNVIEVSEHQSVTVSLDYGNPMAAHSFKMVTIEFRAQNHASSIAESQIEFVDSATNSRRIVPVIAKLQHNEIAKALLITVPEGNRIGTFPIDIDPQVVQDIIFRPSDGIDSVCKDAIDQQGHLIAEVPIEQPHLNGVIQGNITVMKKESHEVIIFPVVIVFCPKGIFG